MKNKEKKCMNAKCKETPYKIYENEEYIFYECSCGWAWRESK